MCNKTSLINFFQFYLHLTWKHKFTQWKKNECDIILQDVTSISLVLPSYLFEKEKLTLGKNHYELWANMFMFTSAKHCKRRVVTKLCKVTWFFFSFQDQEWNILLQDNGKREKKVNRVSEVWYMTGTVVSMISWSLKLHMKG